jgi:hypothetical protein
MELALNVPTTNISLQVEMVEMVHVTVSCVRPMLQLVQAIPQQQRAIQDIKNRRTIPVSNATQIGFWTQMGIVVMDHAFRVLVMRMRRRVRMCQRPTHVMEITGSGVRLEDVFLVREVQPESQS